MDKKAFAKDLISRGFDIFPIKPGCKYPPLIKDFPKISEQCSQFVNSWWANGKNNIGIHCKNLLVLDVDSKKDGYKTLSQLEIEYGLPETLEFSTPSGGIHILYATGTPVSNSVERIGPGIDVRTNGGYIVAPGSSVESGDYTILSDNPIVQAPGWLVQKCRQPKDTPGEPVTGSADQNVACSRAVEWLNQVPVAIEGQGGDHYTYSVICKIRDLGVDQDNALEILAGWNARCEPPWDVHELHTKIKNAYKYAQNPPGTDSVEAMFDVVQETDAFNNNEQKKKLNDDEMYGPDDVNISSVLDSNYIIKGWLDSGTQSLLFGHWGAGKTFIALHMAAHITSDNEWFGHRVHSAGVLYFGYEGPVAMQRRVYALRKEFPEWDFSRFKLRPLRWPLVRRNAGDSKLVGQQKVETALQVYKQETGEYPALVIIDPLRNALGGSDSDPDLTAPFLNYLQKLTKITGCSTMTIHHPGHGDADRGRGDSGIESHMDTVIKVDGDRGRIETRKQRDDPTSALYYRLRVVNLGEDADGDMRTTCVVEPVEQNALDPNLTDQQQSVFSRLQDIAVDDVISKGDFRRAAEGLPKTVQDEIFEVFLTKHYLVPEGKKWRIGIGAAEMFT